MIDEERGDRSGQDEYGFVVFHEDVPFVWWIHYGCPATECRVATPGGRAKPTSVG